MKSPAGHDDSQRRWLTIFSAIVITVGVWWAFRRLGWASTYVNDIAPMASVLTVFAALFIWFEQSAARHRAQLPRRLMVKFIHEKELVCSPPLANLAHEADARLLAQQIARHINGGRDCVFEPTRIIVEHKGETKVGEEEYYLVVVTIELKDKDQVERFRTYQVGKADSSTPPTAHAPAMAADLKLFVCAGEASPPEEGYKILSLPAELRREDIEKAAAQTRQLLAGVQNADIVIKGPVVLGVAIGQYLEHVPCHVRYLQLNQANKQFETWWQNTLVK
jgi:hypothetical protein